MGKSTRWLLSLIGLKKSSKPSPNEKKSSQDGHAKHEVRKSTKEKRRWSFGKSSSPERSFQRSDYESLEQDQAKHAIAVAAASAAAAEAAVAAAQAAAAVVRLTGGGAYPPVFELISREEWAAIKIQTAFRGYLARRALRALKAVLRIQALFRGHRVRKQAAITLRCMQALVRVQARVRARRVRMSEEGLAVQQQLLQRREQQQGRSRKSVDGWNASTATVEDLQAKNERRQLGAMKRERALAYAFSQCNQRAAAPMVIDCEPDTPHWGWSWLERWMAARPWENPFEGAPESSPVSGSTKIVEIDPAGKQKRRLPKKRMGSASESLSADHPNATAGTGSRSSPPRALPYSSPAAAAAPQASSEQNAAHLSHPSPASVNDHSGRTITIDPLICRDVVPTRDFLAEEDNVWSTAKTGTSPGFGLKPLNNVNEQPKDEELLAAVPNYMATTQSSKAKLRSHSTPKQRPEALPETPRKRNSLPSSGLESRSISGGLRSQRSSSQLRLGGRGLSGSVVLDRSLISLRDGLSAFSVNGDLRKPFRF